MKRVTKRILAVLLIALMIVPCSMLINAVADEDAEYFTVIFDANGGEFSSYYGSEIEESYAKGSSISFYYSQFVYAPNRRCITGWATDKEGNNQIDLETYVVESDITLYAIWGNTWRFSFVDSEIVSRTGKSVDDFEVVKGEPLEKAFPYYPSAFGYYNGETFYRGVSARTANAIFIGWSTDEQGKNIVDKTYIPESDITLYAIYKTAHVRPGDIISLFALEDSDLNDGFNRQLSDVVWTSSDSEIVSVDNNGNINAIAPGKVTITATWTNESGGPEEASCEIVVEGDAMLGDVNGSGDVTADDLTALARHVAKIETITDTSLLKAADVTSDGDVTADDLTKLARFVAKIITTLE